MYYKIYRVSAKYIVRIIKKNKLTKNLIILTTSFRTINLGIWNFTIKGTVSTVPKRNIFSERIALLKTKIIF